MPFIVPPDIPEALRVNMTGWEKEKGAIRNGEYFLYRRWVSITMNQWPLRFGEDKDPDAKFEAWIHGPVSPTFLVRKKHSYSLQYSWRMVRCRPMSWGPCRIRNYFGKKQGRKWANIDRDDLNAPQTIRLPRKDMPFVIAISRQLDNKFCFKDLK